MKIFHGFWVSEYDLMAKNKNLEMSEINRKLYNKKASIVNDYHC